MREKFGDIDEKVDSRKESKEPFELVSLNDLASVKHIKDSQGHGSRDKATQLLGDVEFFDSKEELDVSNSAHSRHGNQRYSDTELSQMDSDRLTYSPSGRSVVKVDGESILDEHEEGKHRYTREELSQMDSDRLTYSPSGRSVVKVDGESILDEQEEAKHKYTREELSRMDPDRLTYSPSGRSVVKVDGLPV